MQKSSICKKWLFLLLTVLLFGGCQKEQQKEMFLPEAENDTIFTVIGEE